MIAERKVSPRELVQAYVDRIEAVNPKVNAFALLLADRALDESRNPRPGRLSGIPVTVKDSFDLEGFATLCGSRFREGHRAAQDSTVAARLRQAGAIILGKTNTPEMLANYESDNHITGRSNNPWNLACTPGGSSGGEAAAIAARMSAGGVGSDGGGSVRWPAHCCGIAGLKVTPGRVSTAGHFPLIHHPGGLLGVAGPMARTVTDLKILFDVMAGHDPADPFSAPVAQQPSDSRGIRVGVMEQFGAVPVQPAVRNAVRAAAALLRQMGFVVDEFAPRGLERAPNLWSFFFSELAVPFTRDMIAGREEQSHWTGTEFYNLLKDKPEPTGKQVVEHLAARDAMRSHVLEQLRDVPVILSPVSSIAAHAHRQRRFATESKEIGQFQAMMTLTWANLLGLPALTVPFTMNEEGLPIGVQLIGRPWEEELLLELGMRLESARDPLPPFPSVI
jgi:Asp-tRNA(Asn)/Glu-tRNA(Gln) amidotransferase A subunit family amidase